MFGTEFVVPDEDGGAVRSLEGAHSVVQARNHQAVRHPFTHLGEQFILEPGEEVDDPEGRAAVEAAMVATIEQALDALKVSREREGSQLLPVITDFVGRIEGLVVSAETEAVAQTEAVRERFARRMSELAPDAPGLQDRIMLEAAALATRADVREELDRLTAHIASARTLLQQPPSGRKLDFLMQEFMREANTLCSKSATTTLTAVGLDLKAVIEQLREQVQNVE
jgi:uncharacterized protein (TIGR00255 family)